jgi:hypothetical protein
MQLTLTAKHWRRCLTKMYASSPDNIQIYSPALLRQVIAPLCGEKKKK